LIFLKKNQKKTSVHHFISPPEAAKYPPNYPQKTQKTTTNFVFYKKNAKFARLYSAIINPTARLTEPDAVARYLYILSYRRYADPGGPAERFVGEGFRQGNRFL
jgi:hypothetical protein